MKCYVLGCSATEDLIGGPDGEQRCLKHAMDYAEILKVIEEKNAAEEAWRDENARRMYER